MAFTMFVSLPGEQASQAAYDSVVRGSITGELIDHYTVTGPEGARCDVLVFEKHYSRAGNRLTLTVTVDNFGQHTRVHGAGGGGGESLFRFDWGASDSFESVVYKALKSYEIR